MRWIQHRLSPVLLLFTMNVSASTLHPLAAPLAESEIHFELKQATSLAEKVLVECEYRPYRERDVRKERHLHLFNSPWRAGSRDLISVQREEVHLVRQEVEASESALRFSIPLRDPDPVYRQYQLAAVRVDGIEFEKWSERSPASNAASGLDCTDISLRGVVRRRARSGAAVAGALPLWPGLRTVQLELTPIALPVVQLWEPLSKHYWDGWREATPQSWPGGRTIVARHIDAPTVWRGHEYYDVSPANDASSLQPVPPAGVLPGIGLEIFWPEGDRLELHEARFSQPASVVGVRVSQLTPRLKALLARSVERRPGIELNSLSQAEWAEIEAAADNAAATPAEFSLESDAKSGGVLVIRRRELNEPWVYFFGVEYDNGRRFATTSLALNPARWSGPLPE